MTVRFGHSIVHLRKGNEFERYHGEATRRHAQQSPAGYAPLLAELDGRACIEIVEAVAAGDNVAQRGATATIGATLVPAGTRLAARHIGLLTITGLSRVPVVRRPRVSILVPKPTKVVSWEDSNGPMIRAAIEHDGGVIGECVAVERDLMVMSTAWSKRVQILS